MANSTSKIFVVGSSIQTRNAPLTYSPVRTVFSSDERFRHTIFTVNSIHNAFPGAKIVLVDSSEDYKEYETLMKYFLNVQFIPLKELSYEAFETVNTHPNKSLCESLLLNTYFRQYKKELKEYDYIIKGCGRYFHFNFNDSLFTEENKDKMFFKKPLNYEWNDSWGYSFIDRREQQKNNRLHQYCTVLYAFGSTHLEKFIDINEAVVHLLKQRPMSHYDIETLLYYFTRQYQDSIIETDWRVCGWDGTSAKFMYY
jgi:hypothetical protein